MRNALLLGTAVLAACLLACRHVGDVYVRPMPEKNPTQAVLPVGRTDVEQCLRRASDSLLGVPVQPKSKVSVLGYEDTTSGKLWVWQCEDCACVNGDGARRGDYRFESHDLLVSPVYVGEAGESLGYDATYVVRVTSLGRERTRVKVKQAQADVVVGEELGIHLTWVYVWRPVPSTTLDEYHIMQWIARCVGHELPPVKLPCRDCPMQELHD